MLAEGHRKDRAGITEPWAKYTYLTAGQINEPGVFQYQREAMILLFIHPLPVLSMWMINTLEQGSLQLNVLGIAHTLGTGTFHHHHITRDDTS